MLKFLAVMLAVLAGAVALMSGGGTTAAGAAPPVNGLPMQTAFSGQLGGVSGTSTEACDASWRPGAAGVATQVAQVPAGVRQVRVTLGGADGDWDVAVFDSTGAAVAASAELDSAESATGWTAVGGELRLQACRRTGDSAGVPVLLEHLAPSTDVDALRANPPQLVSVSTPTRADKDRLVSLGLDLSEHGGTDSIGVVLHDAADRAVLRRAGLSYDVVVRDLVADDFREREAEMRAAARRPNTILPSGHTTTYRTLANYNDEMKALAMTYPTMVRTFVMPNKTWLGKDVMGIEVAQNVTANDGRPAFFNMGVHHAREWPSGEMAMEWAYELLEGAKDGEARALNILAKSRNIIVPIVNADGFEASRTAGQLSPTNMGEGQPEDVPDTAYIVSGGSTGGEYRRKNCRLGDQPMGNCATSVGLAEPGTDPNRNYGQFWGGPGADTNPATQTYRGPGPFSEPESNNIRDVVSHNQVTTLITNHTTAALVLRAPGLASQGDPFDENKGYKALGDAMAKQNGYFSQKGFELYDTTGTTEDWSYNATGGFGFTIEIYCGDPNYVTGDCDDPAFHPRFNTGVEKEWNGDNPTADHTNDPAGAFNGQGMREAYYIAAESTINEARHSIIEGTAPAGATLRLKKTFKTPTSPQPQASGPAAPILVDDTLETTYTVGSGGTYQWHINPSTRPFIEKDRGIVGAGPPSPEEETTGDVLGSSETGDDPDDGAAVPMGTSTLSYNDHPFAIPATGDNISVNLLVQWNTPASDWDLELFEDVNGNGKSDAGDKSLAVAENSATTEEQVAIQGAPRLTPGKKYVLRVVNYAAGEPYTVTKTYVGPEPFQAGTTESWTLTCEVGGQVRQTTSVTIDRGERKTFNQDLCASGATATTTPTATVTTSPTTDVTATATTGPVVTQTPVTTPTVTPTPKPCTLARGLRSARVVSRGAGALLAFERRSGVTAPVQIRVFQPATPTRVLKTRSIRTFEASQDSVKWNGLDRKGRAISDGFYFVRFLVKTDSGTDIRRVVLERRDGVFTTLRPFDRRATCDALRVYKLSRPVFGGTTRFPLRAAFKLATAGDVEVALLRGTKVVETIARPDQPAGRRVALTLPSANLSRGNYTIRISIVNASGSLTTELFSRKI